MAITPPFFNKRESEHPSLRPATSAAPVNTKASAHAAAHQAAQHAANAAAAAPMATPAKEGGSKLTVGPNIKLKGVEITDCDTLLVEGIVEATMDSRLMQIAASGSFRGSAEIDIAEIHGQFDGSLTVREKLVIHATGRVSGQIRYGKLVVEEGGQLSGDVVHGTAGGATAAGKPVLQAA